MEFYVFDLDFALLGEISEYKEVEVERNYDNYSLITLNVLSNPEMLRLLKHRNIITSKDNTSYGYIIENFFYTDESEMVIEIHAYSLNWFLSWRTIEKQQRYSGNLEAVMKSFVDKNCINPDNPSRVIPNLVLGPDTGIDIMAESTKTGSSVGNHCFELAKEFEVSIDILMNHSTKEFEVITWQGADRSVLQDVNPHVIFSKEYDNIINQSYVDSRTDYKTTAIVAGEGEGLAREVVTVNDEVDGFDRREVYIDARDLQSEYTTESGEEKTLTPSEYTEALEKRGSQKLSDYKIIETFESEVDMYSQFIYGTDYALGDKVSSRNDEIGISLHTRVISTTIKCDGTGKKLNIDFGTTIPDLAEKIMKKVK